MTDESTDPTQPQDSKAVILDVLDKLRTEVEASEAPGLVCNHGAIHTNTPAGPVVEAVQIQLSVFLPQTEQGKAIVAQIVAQAQEEMEARKNPRRIVVGRG